MCQPSPVLCQRIPHLFAVCTQLPGPDLCRGAPRLELVVLERDDAVATLAEVEAALAALTALPALRVLVFDLYSAEWAISGDAEAFTAAICAAKPGLQVYTQANFGKFIL